MKVKLKLTEKQISAVVNTFTQSSREPAKERIAKVAKSVLDKVVLNFKTKQLKVQISSTLFNSNEKFTFSLELVEAHFLEQYLFSIQDFTMSEYDKNAINQIIAILNQQLA